MGWFNKPTSQTVTANVTSTNVNTNTANAASGALADADEAVRRAKQRLHAKMNSKFDGGKE
jgi:hypothetical protein